MTKFTSDQHYQDIWNAQITSGNRSDSEKYLDFKAQEHSWIVNNFDYEMKCIDLGCGAGELLKFLTTKLQIYEALDFSITMINKAKKEVLDEKIKFIHEDPFNYMPNCEMAVWLTTGALNQYLDQNRMDELIRMFKNNNSAKSFYLFDCIDPIRYQTLTLGSYYLMHKNNNTYKVMFKKIITGLKLIYVSLATTEKNTTIKFKDPKMGFGYLPIYWHKKAIENNLDIHIFSSINFEYRYHVFFTKKCI